MRGIVCVIDFVIVFLSLLRLLCLRLSVRSKETVDKTFVLEI